MLRKMTRSYDITITKLGRQKRKASGKHSSLKH
jgi:hypothetical protein